MKLFIRIVIFFILFSSCRDKSTNEQTTFSSKVNEAIGYEVPQDCLKTPNVILLDENKLFSVPINQPASVPINTNIHPFKSRKIVLAGQPTIIIPGVDTFLLPQIIFCKDSSFMANVPEEIVVKDAATKDQNPQNFSTYNKLQGLKHGTINCLHQDKIGNLWFGSSGGGVCKFDGKIFTHFTMKEGLSNNSVYCILEDHDGNLWFGTNGGGVSKYDGKKFTYYSEIEGLINNIVFDLIEDKVGNIWFATAMGVSKFDGKNFTQFTEKQGLCNNGVYTILEDKKGNLWFGTNGGGVSKFDGKSFTNYSDKQGIVNNFVWNIIEDDSSNIWFATEGGACKFNGETFEYFTTDQGMSSNSLYTLYQDKAGNFWFGSADNGISFYNGKTITHYGEKEGLSSSSILAILEDNSGNFWFGTSDGGLSQYCGQRFTHYTQSEGLRNNFIYSLIEDKNGNIWFGANGGGLNKYRENQIVTYTEKEGLASDLVMTVFEDHLGNLWVGTAAGVSKYDGSTFTTITLNEGLNNEIVRAIVEDQFGNIWFGTSGGGISKYDGKSLTNFTVQEGLSNNIILCGIQDHLGNLWFGTGGGGVTKISLEKSKENFQYRFTHFSKEQGIGGDVVYDMREDKSGNIWFGTDGGVCKYEPETENEKAEFVIFSETHGLNSDVVLSVLIDKNENLWFGTRFGICMLTKDKETQLCQKIKSNTVEEEDIFFKNYSYDEGFLGIGCNKGAILQASDGEIWIGANDRLTIHHPQHKLEKMDSSLSIQITGIQLFNEKINWLLLETKKDTNFILGNGVSVGDFEFDEVSNWYHLPKNLSLSYNNNYLTFNFIGVTMSQPKKVKYQYKLEGMDENWSAITDRAEATYGNIPHGNYTFMVKAMNSDGYWSEELHYSFSIRPPWWKTWWFRVSLAVIIVLLLFVLYRWRTNSLRKRQKRLEATVKLRTAELSQEKKIVEEKHKEITDSINYAERIQRSFLATKELLDENLKDYFVLFQPKDIVSGDFYWATKLANNNFALVTADSTGHGVPGAIMSILNITCLEKAVLEDKLNDPADILNHARLNIIDRLKKDGSIDGGKDGMDASLICFDFENKKLTYAAANNPVWIVRKNEVLEFAPDKMPVGKHDKQHLPFTSNQISLESGDIIYTLTDGLPDQFGGEKGKKFMYKRLKELLITISSQPMHMQRESLRENFTKWKGDLEQVDDVCVIGVHI